MSSSRATRSRSRSAASSLPAPSGGPSSLASDQAPSPGSVGPSQARSGSQQLSESLGMGPSQGTAATPAARRNNGATPRSRRSAPNSTPRTGQYALFNPRRASSTHISTPGSNMPSQDDSYTQGGDGQGTIFGTTINTEDTRRRFSRFFRNFTNAEGDVVYISMITEMLDNEVASLNLDCADLLSYDPDLYEQLIHYPGEATVLLDSALSETAHGINAQVAADLVLKVNMFNLNTTKPMRDLNPSDIETLVSIKGMVTRTSGIIPQMKEACFVCQTCGAEEAVAVDDSKVEEPVHCSNCNSKFTLRLVHNLSKFFNKQMIKLQESPDQIPEGETPHTCTLFSTEEHVDTCKPGDRVTVTGIYKATPVRVNPKNRAVKCIYKTHLHVVHIGVEHTSTLFSAASSSQPQTQNSTASEVLGEPAAPVDSLHQRHVEELRQMASQPDIYEQLTQSLAPSIWGMDEVKRGILCQLFGGVRKSFSGGSTRGELNVLMVGDPGVSKSQILNYVHKIAPRGIYTSGRGSSAVGLTAYVTKDPETREMVLESGALVLSDLGVCCIDEFDKMSESARSMLHEVMEQQTVSVAKAGIISTLNARTSVLAAANPVESRYNRDLNIVENLKLPPSLLSRFDLIYLLLDEANEDHDRRLARHLVGMHFEFPPEKAAARISSKQMREFVAYARQECHPKLTDEAAQKLIDGYVDLRTQGQSTGRSKTITATPRQLESLIRISEALARMRLSETIATTDVEEAIRLMLSALSTTRDPTTGESDMGLINTGVSSRDRDLVRALPEELRKMIDGNGASSGSISGLLAQLQQQTSQNVTLEQVRTALREVESVDISHNSVWRKRGTTA